jgi:hypothetical protein
MSGHNYNSKQNIHQFLNMHLTRYPTYNCVVIESGPQPRSSVIRALLRGQESIVLC